MNTDQTDDAVRSLAADKFALEHRLRNAVHRLSNDQRDQFKNARFSFKGQRLTCADGITALQWTYAPNPPDPQSRENLKNRFGTVAVVTLAQDGSIVK